MERGDSIARRSSARSADSKHAGLCYKESDESPEAYGVSVYGAAHKLRGKAADHLRVGHDVLWTSVCCDKHVCLWGEISVKITLCISLN